ncbi:hypothetical protein D9M72_424030 [compost metagenome]
MHHLQDRDRDHAADQRADHAVVVALLGHAEVGLQDDDDGQQDPVAVRYIGHVLGDPQSQRHRHRDPQRETERRRTPLQVVAQHAELILLARQERRHVRAGQHPGRLHRRARRFVQLADQRDRAAHHVERFNQRRHRRRVDMVVAQLRDLGLDRAQARAVFHRGVRGAAARDLVGNLFHVLAHLQHQPA